MHLLLGLIAIVLLAFHPRSALRAALSLTIAAVSLADLTYYEVTARHLDYSEAERLLGLLGFADGAIEFYSLHLLKAAGWCLLGIVAINMPPFYDTNDERDLFGRLVAFGAVIQLMPTAAIATILYLRGGDGTDGLPAQYKGLSFLSAIAMHSALTEAPGPRRTVSIAPSTAPVKHVVLVMDESVRGDLLDFNSQSGVYTGLKASDRGLVNFGVASSIANCSEATNASFRFGVTRKNYLIDLVVNPSIFAYARKAGFRTVYLDGQLHGRRLQNRMDEDELSLIDDFFQFESGEPLVDRDAHLGRRVRELLTTSEKPVFILVNKMGLHFPYEGKYPADQSMFKPTMTANYFGTEADPKMKVALGEDSANRRAFKNSYLNALRWNTSRFFEELLSGLDLSNVVLGYTADHGQDFHEDGRPGYGTHCNGGAVAPEEGMVPLVFLTEQRDVLKILSEAAETNRGNASQFNLFPTLLILMGYRQSDLSPVNGFETSLLERLPQDNRRFLSTFQVRFGKQPWWNTLKTTQ